MTKSPPIRVLLADDTPEVRALLRLTLESSKAFEVVAEAGDGRAAVEMSGSFHPELVLLDLAMPLMDGLDAIPLIRECSPSSRIVVVSGFNADPMESIATKRGADAYLEKRYRPDDMVRRLLAVCREPDKTAGGDPSEPRSRPVEPPIAVEAQARRNRERFRLAFDNAPIGMAVLDLDSRFVMVNDALTRMTGFSREALLANGPKVLSHPDDADSDDDFDADLGPHVVDGQTQASSREKHFVRANGSPGWVLLSWSVLRDDAGQPAEYLVHAADITEARRVDEVLRLTAEELARSNVDLTDFAAVAAHDLRAPLQVIAGFADLLARLYGSQLDERGREFIGWISRGAANMTELVDDLLAYAQVGASDVVTEPVDLQTLLDRLLSTPTLDLSRATLMCPAMLPVVAGDPGHLAMVMSNLIGNALKFVRDGVDPEIVVDAEPVPEGWMITVDDNGIGIEPEARDRVFGMFERLESLQRYDGTGIGLSICKRIVERGGGRIWVEDNPAGSGSRFCFIVPGPHSHPAGSLASGHPSASIPPAKIPAEIDPRPPSATPTPKPATTVRSESSGTLDVLLVEDSDSHAELVAATLTTAPAPGYRLRRAGSLREAREILATFHPSCILLDLTLPDGRGVDSVTEILDAGPSLPIVVLTSLDDASLAATVVHLGAQDYLVKGHFDVESLGRSIRYAIERNGLRSELARLALRDALTGLPNRTLVLDRLRMALGRAPRYGESVAVLYLDLDGFKEINDRFGHAAGDAVLVEVGRRLQHSVRPQDTTGRLGGDEFVVVCDGLVDAGPEIEHVRLRILDAIGKPIHVDGGDVHVGASIGAAVSSAGDETAQDLLATADQAMFQAKRRRDA